MEKPKKIYVDVTANLFALCEIQCLAFTCKYHQAHYQEGSLNCNLKQISIGASGRCMTFEDGRKGHDE